MVVNTINKSYPSRNKIDPPRTTSAPSTSFQGTDSQAVKTPNSQGTNSFFPPSKYNILNQLANIKAYASVLDMVAISKQQQHLKIFMEGKISTVAKLTKNPEGDDSNVNKIGVHNFKNLVKYPPFYVYVNIMDKIAHCCLIDGGSHPSVMSKIIMEELGLSCTNENARICSPIIINNNLPQMKSKM
jgi:hypothetical protein